MAFHLEEAKPEDFPELIRCLWESYETPHQQFFRLYCPIIGSGPTAREDSLKACTERMLSYHLEDSTSYWQKVIDDPSGKIVAGALWKICEKNPFENGFHAEIADWWPEGGEREFITATIKKHEVARSYFARRPQICKFILCFIHHYRFIPTSSCPFILLPTYPPRTRNIPLILQAPIYHRPYKSTCKPLPNRFKHYLCPSRPST